MTKAEVINQIADQTGIDKADVQITVEAFFSVVKSSMTAGENIYVRGFGSFVVKDYEAYMGRNPKTGEVIQVRPKKLPFFKVGKELRDKVNSKS